MVLTTFACALILNCVKLQAQSKLWLTPAEFSKLKNPVTVDPVSIKNGKTLYTSYCTPCHGDKGKGDGAAAVALNPKPADHTSPAMLKETDGSLFYKISEGRTPMPQYKADTHRQATMGSCELCTHIMQNFSEIKFVHGYR